MKIEVITAQELDAELLDTWHALQQSSTTLDSPFFSAAFTRAVGLERRGVEIAIVEDENEVVGLLPYSRDKARVGGPVAGKFSDFQGMVLKPDAVVDPRQLLRQCQLSSWQFNHLIADQTLFEPYHWAHSKSPYMDLSNGFESYRVERRKAGSDELQEALRKSRKIERDVAPLTFETHTTNYRVLESLIAWKRDQLRKGGRPDCFRPAWVVPMLERLLHTRGESFQSMLSALYVGDALLAVNYGLRWGSVMHGWITAFNPEYRKFSPGLILLARLAQSAESLGIRRIDMGRGKESFKKSFGSGSRLLAEGAVDRRFVAGSVQRNWVRAKELIRATPLDAPARQMMNSLRSATGWLRQSLGAEEAA